MPLVNNATGVYATLGYNFDDPNNYVNNLSSNAQAHLNSMPAFIQTWQAEDISDNNIGGYYQNPVANDVILIRNAASNIAFSSANVSSLANVVNISILLANTCNAFLQHTDRISGVTPFGGGEITSVEDPYFDTAMAVGKTALYLTNQTDSIVNSSPIMGSFTSILVGPQISANANTIIIYSTQVKNSISGLESETTNLSPTQITTINTYLHLANTFLSDRKTNDVTYYNNLKDFINKYNSTKKFVNMGETERFLVMNIVGTDKIKSRIS
jgi:hypothetical protein